MASLTRSLQALVSGASVPELKEALRQFEVRFPRSKELSQQLLRNANLEGRNSRVVLSNVVERLCERFEECRWIVEELLDVDEDEFPRRSYILDGSDGEERDSEVGVMRRKRKKKKKRKIDSPSPERRQKTRKNKCNNMNCTPPDVKPTKIQRTSAIFSQAIARKPLVRSEISSASPSAPPSSAPKGKRTIREIFEADRQRRELEALKEAQRRKEEAEMRAKCAQCGKIFLTDDNFDNSCVFHSGARRCYHPADYSLNCRWFCCGRKRWDEGCMEAKHIDDRIPGEIERIEAIRESAQEEAGAVLYRSCENCDKDVIVELDSSDSEADETAPGHASDRFLCNRCIEEAAAKRLQCTTCGEDFEALPSHDAYTADEPVCLDCFWTELWHGHAHCSRCWKSFKLLKRPYWYDFDDDDVQFCMECKAKELEDEGLDSIEGG